MNIYNAAYKIGIYNFIAMLVFLAIANVIPEEVKIEEYILPNILGFILSVGIVGSGLFLWVTGFKRFEPTIGKYGKNWILYISFSLVSAFYLHYKYSSLEQGN